MRAFNLGLGAHLVYFSFPDPVVDLVGYGPNEVVLNERDVEALATLEGVEPFTSDDTLIKQ